MKKIAYLKAKKAFTLVELVVVIAIIGILSAILIPTLVGAARSASVASANTTAKDIRQSINAWLTKMDSEGHYTIKISNKGTEPSITVTADRGVYVPVFSDNVWIDSEDEDALVESLANHLMKNLGYREMYTVAYLDNGAVAALCYCVNASEAPSDLPTFSDFSRNDYWQGDNGYSVDGYVVGTSPQITNG